MAKDKTLKAALDRVKGVDHKKLFQKKLQKQAEKTKLKKQRSKVDIGALEDALGGAEEIAEAQALLDEAREAAAADGASAEERVNGEVDGWETDESENAEEDDEDEEGGVGLGTFEDESESDSDGDETFYTAAGGSPVKKARANGAPAADDKEEDEDEDDEGIPLSDLEDVPDEEKEDVVPYQRLTINNTAALQRSLKSFALPTSLPFSATQSVISAEPIAIEDVENDLQRELAFYTQSLAAVKEARIKLKREGVPFSRPVDYFAEMVKSEEQMGKVKAKMKDEAARKQASADARRQRDLKKFGKQVQVAKIQERDRAKRDMLDKVNSLKRKRSGGAGLTATEDDMFDVALEDAAETEKRSRRNPEGGRNAKRQKKDEKFGFGGKKKRAKSNDAKSAGDMSGYSVKRMKGGARGGAKQRPGKSRRQKM